MLWLCSTTSCATDPQHLDVSSCRGSVAKLLLSFLFGMAYMLPSHANAEACLTDWPNTYRCRRVVDSLHSSSRNESTTRRQRYVLGQPVRQASAPACEESMLAIPNKKERKKKLRNRSTTRRHVEMLWIRCTARRATNPQHLDVSSCCGFVARRKPLKLQRIWLNQI